MMNMIEQEAFKARLGVIPQKPSESDRHGNPVTIITMADGTIYRMVHHQTGWRPRQRYTIYAGRGKFVRVKTFSPSNDCVMHECEIAGYGQGWGDGDPCGATTPTRADGPNVRDLIVKALLNRIGQDDFDAVILIVLHAIKGDDGAWEYREPGAPREDRATLGLARVGANEGRY